MGTLSNQRGKRKLTLRSALFLLRISFPIAVLALCTVETTAQMQKHGGHGLGVVNFPVSCSSEAQAEFNYAVALLHHMTYPHAREAFEHVAMIDSNCAMADWGVAMTLF